VLRALLGFAGVLGRLPVRVNTVPTLEADAMEKLQPPFLGASSAAGGGASTGASGSLMRPSTLAALTAAAASAPRAASSSASSCFTAAGKSSASRKTVKHLAPQRSGRAATPCKKSCSRGRRVCTTSELVFFEPALFVSLGKGGRIAPGQRASSAALSQRNWLYRRSTEVPSGFSTCRDKGPVGCMREGNLYGRVCLRSAVY